MKNNEIKSYFCTWSAQNFLAGESLKALSEDERKLKLLDCEGAKLARDIMNEESIFGENGLAYQFDADIRKELYFMFDDGWDVDYGIHPDANIEKFASLNVSSARFPFVLGSPKERLKSLNNAIKEIGWKGIGIWVCSQISGPSCKKPFSIDDDIYWIEKILESKYANVEYWKVDWGTYQEDVSFRKRLTELAKIYYPELTIEHAICVSPLNYFMGSSDMMGRFRNMKHLYEKSLETIKFADVFRTYDVLSELSIPTTLDRIGEELSNTNGYLNGEDEVYINACLGLQSGIMRSYKHSDKMNEVVASIRFQKIAKPFFNGVCYKSEEILFDNYKYKENETWFGEASNKSVSQGAPAIISRNVSLPKVIGENVPYVVATKFINDVYSVGTFKRVNNRSYYYPLVDIECDFKDAKIIGVFGKYKSITFKTFTKPIKVYVKSLIGDKSLDITNYVEIINDGFTIFKNIIDLVWNKDDNSESAFLIKIKY